MTDKDRTGFGIVPRYLWGKVTPSEMAVYVALTWMADDYGTCFPSMKTIAEAAGCSISTVKTAISGLQEKGILESESRQSPTQGQVSNSYRLLVYKVRKDHSQEHNALSTPPSESDYPPSQILATPQPNIGYPPSQILATPQPKFGYEREPVNDTQTRPDRQTPKKTSRSGQVRVLNQPVLPKAAADDFELVAAVLPPAWAAKLDSQMTAIVAAAVRPLLEAGWPASAIRAKVGSRLPSEVHSLGHLLVKRIENLPKDWAPAPEAPEPGQRKADAVRVDVVPPPWEADMSEAKRSNDPSCNWERRGLWVTAWIKLHPAEVAAWREAHPGHELHVPVVSGRGEAPGVLDNDREQVA